MASGSTMANAAMAVGDSYNNNNKDSVIQQIGLTIVVTGCANINSIQAIMK